MGNFSYEIDELLNEAIITGVPVLIVEGIDDIAIYENISDSVPFDVEVYAIETIDGFREGCEQVINAIVELNSLPNNSHALSEHVLGIIDKDVRDYRKEIPQVNPILVLNYYSIESHFVSSEVTSNILNLVTKTNRGLVSEELCALVMDEIETKLLELYYFSLEALCNSLNPEYESSFSYSCSAGRVSDAATQQAVLNKKDSLDSFALGHNLSPGLDTLKMISKGKWLIDIYAHEILQAIRGLPERCRSNSIQTCRCCLSGAHEKCLYRLREGFTKKSIKSLILSDISGAEVNYIRQRIENIRAN